MPDPSWPGLPPEVNYLRLVGPGAAGTATTMANALGWQAVAVANEAAVSQSMLNAAATAPSFEGVGGTSSLASVTGLNTSLQLLAAWAQEKPPVVASAVAAYEAAVSAMIPAEMSLFNRTEQAANVAMNPAVFGALTPVIVALDAAYFGEHWPHNAGIGVAYGAALTALAAALAIPVPLSPPGASGVAPATAAAAVAQAAGRAVADEALAESAQAAGGGGAAAPTAAAQSGQTVMQPAQAMLGALQPAMGMFQIPMQAAQGLAGLPQSAAGLLGPAPGGAEPPALAGAPAGVGGMGVGAGVGGMGVSAGAGGIPTGAGGLPSSGITSYSRPASSFALENAGRPTGHGGVGPGAAEWRGPTTTGGGLPMGPAGAGMLARGKEAGEQDCGPRARVVADLVVEDGKTRQTGFRTGP